VATSVDRACLLFGVHTHSVTMLYLHTPGLRIDKEQWSSYSLEQWGGEVHATVLHDRVYSTVSVDYSVGE
jgi:hypothetical protein